MAHQDLTNITTPFGLLDAETQEALRAHGGPYEIWDGLGWCKTSSPDWQGYSTYRVKPQPPKPREWWVCGSHAVTNALCTPEEELRKQGWIKVREVLE